MKKIKVISYKDLPVRMPLVSTAVAYLYLDRYNAPGWLFGVTSTLLVMLWILFFIAKYFQEQVDVLKPDTK